MQHLWWASMYHVYVISVLQAHGCSIIVAWPSVSNSHQLHASSYISSANPRLLMYTTNTVWSLCSLVRSQYNPYLLLVLYVRMYTCTVASGVDSKTPIARLPSWNSSNGCICVLFAFMAPEYCSVFYVLLCHYFVTDQHQGSIWSMAVTFNYAISEHICSVR